MVPLNLDVIFVFELWRMYILQGSINFSFAPLVGSRSVVLAASVFHVTPFGQLERIAQLFFLCVRCSEFPVLLSLCEHFKW